MFFSLAQIESSLANLVSLHPFFGITFLVCKEGRLPVGRVVEFPINTQERYFLDRYYKPSPDSQYYYRVFRPSDRQKKWVANNYASSTLQSARTRGDLQPIFAHTKNTDLWGWRPDYRAILRKQLQQRYKKLIPAFDLAVWIFRDRDWPTDVSASAVVQQFFSTFNITKEEGEKLFDAAMPEAFDPGFAFQDAQVTWQELRTVTGSPPDAPQEEEGTLSYLEIQGTGPAKRLVFAPADRLNVITGDNGLGKSFLLECGWWALTGQWAGLPAYPRADAKAKEPRITFQLFGGRTPTEKIAVSYDWGTQEWPLPKKNLTIPGLTVYARVDGSFAICDPAKTSLMDRNDIIGGHLRPMVFTADQVWNGLERDASGRSGAFINGLIRDWVTWQNQPGKYPFETFREVLRRLSPPSEGDLGELRPGEPVRLPFDAREVPTLEHPYGTVPVIYASAGVRRILALAYLIVWAWYEHQITSEFIRRRPQRRMVILIDEMEAHLHPQWQRVILPALLALHEALSSDLQMQFLVATHSPLVLTSAESYFDTSKDKLLHLNLVRQDLFGSEVRLEELKFTPYGVVDSWLMSDVFELRQPRSLEAEAAIEEARALQLQDNPSTGDVQRVSEQLTRTLAADDEFWPLWVYFAEQHGVKL
jgi:hypothetical protein